MLYIYLAHPKYFYKDFDIAIPNGYTSHGIDVSRYQERIEWEDVKEMNSRGISISFVFIKSTEGTSYVDPKFKTNFKAAKDMNLKRGAYLYFHPSMNGAAQAKQFIRHTPLKSGDFAPVIDIEETDGMSRNQIHESLKQCIETLEEEYRVKPIIYANADFYTNHLAPEFDSYPLWVAHYYVSKPRIQRDWQIWQHSDRGRVNGIKNPVDFNVINIGPLVMSKITI